MNYQDYLRSPEWKLLRGKARDRAKNRCEHCGGDPDHVHHVRYPKNLKDDTLENLIVVCESCHKKHHGIRGNEMNNAIVLHFEDKQLVATQYGEDLLFRFRDAFDALEYGESTSAFSAIKNTFLPTQVYASAWSRIPEAYRVEMREEIDGMPDRIERYIKEKGLYRMAMHSNSAKADRFQDWLADVAMCIRQHGCYPAPQQTQPTTASEALLMTVQQLVAVERKQIEHDDRISQLEKERDLLAEQHQQLKDSVARTVAAPGFFSIRQYMLMVGMNPELKVGNERAKQLLGRIAGHVGREKGVTPGKIIEGSMEPNTWPANIIDEAIKRSGLH
jgi:prophage antirepressor-like protein